MDDRSGEPAVFEDGSDGYRQFGIARRMLGSATGAAPRTSCGRRSGARDASCPDPKDERPVRADHGACG
jgi:hypothetical protein